MFGKEKKKQRFIVVESDSGLLGGYRILVDTKTGVNYLNTVGDACQGLTPLLDENGDVIITPASELSDAE